MADQREAPVNGWFDFIIAGGTDAPNDGDIFLICVRFRKNQITGDRMQKPADSSVTVGERPLTISFRQVHAEVPGLLGDPRRVGMGWDTTIRRSRPMEASSRVR